MNHVKGSEPEMTVPEPTTEVTVALPPRGRTRRGAGAVGRGLRASWRWFRSYRRTRPFWGGLWCILAGLWIIRAMSFSIGLALTGGWSYAAGYVMGGGLVLFGLTAWLAPHYRTLCGLVAFLIALGAFPTANLGGYLVGSVLGVIGASMIWSWGEKLPRERSRRGGRRSARPEEVSVDGAASP